MTRKEILNGLYDIKSWHCNGDSEMYSIIAETINLLEQEPCDDVVSREAAISIIYDYEYKKDMRKALEDLPSVTPAKKVGRWIKSDIPNEEYVCSECGGACWYYDYEAAVAKSRYCPNCGSRMGEVEE